MNSILEGLKEQWDDFYIVFFDARDPVPRALIFVLPYLALLAVGFFIGGKIRILLVAIPVIVFLGLLIRWLHLKIRDMKYTKNMKADEALMNQEEYTYKRPKKAA